MLEVCENCKNVNSIIEDYINGIIVCTKCGLVYEENVVADEYEKRTSEGENEIKRVGPPTRPEQEGELGTTLIIREKGHTKVIKTYSKKSKIHKNFNRINRLLSNVGVYRNIIETTKTLYGQLAEKKNMQGRNLNHIIVALYYYALRIEQIPQSYKEVAKTFTFINERQIKKAFTSIEREIGECETQEDIIKKEKNYIHLYIGGNKKNVKSLAYEIIENINKNAILEGKSPNTVAGLSLQLSYKLLSDNSDNSKDFFSTFSVKNTLNKAYIEVKPHLDKIIPSNFSKKIEDLKKWII